MTPPETRWSPAFPKPDWSREGETWRVEPEDGWVLVDGYRCLHRGGRRGMPVHCHRDAVAGLVRHGAVRFALCERHLREQRVWIDETWRVVSWRLSA